MKHGSAEKKRRIIGRLELPVWVSVIMLCAFIALTFYVLAHLNSEDDMLYYMEMLSENPILVALNLLPIVWVVVFLYAISRRAIFSGLLGFGIFTLMGVVNYIKSTLRNDPFVAGDLPLIKEIFSIAKNISGIIPVIITSVLVLILVIIVFLVFRADKVKWYVSAILCLTVAASAAWGYSTLYQDEQLNDEFSVLYVSRATTANRKGFTYSFLNDLATNTVPVPDDYNAVAFANLEEAADDPEIYADAEKPHIIMVMGEAFSSVSEEDAFDFSDYTDPLTNYKQIAADSVISGDLMVDTYGGGTTSTEFMALTGIGSSVFDMTYPYDYIHSKTFSLPWVLAKIGYERVAVHPGNGWFYNRENVYKYLGFTEFYTLENSFDFTTQTKGGYISEEATFEKLIDVFQSHLDTSDAPLFEMCVTIQNHGGYGGKYPLNAESNFDSDIDFSDEDTKILSDYFHGLQDADNELAILVEYLNALDEPVVLVYFGDHLPSLSATIFDELGYSFERELESLLAIYSTPYFIWQNEAARQSGTIESNLANTELEGGEQISAFYLGSTLMQLLGFDGLSPFFTYINDLRAIVPCKQWDIYRDGAGTAMYGVPESAGELMDHYYLWSYYKLFGQKKL